MDRVRVRTVKLTLPASMISNQNFTNKLISIKSLNCFNIIFKKKYLIKTFYL